MFKKSTWMSKGNISQAVKIFESKLESSNPKVRDAATEGIACLTGAKTEYLMNLIKSDHPDRIKALQILENA